MTIKVNGKEVATMKEFEFEDGERLWQAISEQFQLVGENDAERLAEWQDLPDDDIKTLLSAAKEAGFIEDYEIN
ncbi:hypothetical protein [Limosilactobacillus ingluviei]|uniref:hypothetical protein n=1 Tax=Limosilactobacillus ingluviei TaxID=148604 RepID=UPI0023EF9E6D|nr:hypothetical protein [Limosilactobacillus ingluviei]